MKTDIVTMLASITLLVGMSHGAIAAPVSCSEALSGEDSCINLTFDIGTNLVAGTMHYISGGMMPNMDVDNPQFTIPTGMQLTSAQLEVSFTNTTASTSPFAVSWDLRNTATFGFLAASCTTLVGSYTCPYGDQLSPTGGAAWSAVMPVPSGGYSVIPGFYLFATPAGGYWDYTFRFVVEPVTVPEPASIALVCMGLLGLAVVRRRTH
jgi:hypothetical protein